MPISYTINIEMNAECLILKCSNTQHTLASRQNLSQKHTNFSILFWIHDDGDAHKNFVREKRNFISHCSATNGNHWIL